MIGKINIQQNLQENYYIYYTYVHVYVQRKFTVIDFLRIAAHVISESFDGKFTDGSTELTQARWLRG